MSFGHFCSIAASFLSLGALFNIFSSFGYYGEEKIISQNYAMICLLFAIYLAIVCIAFIIEEKYKK